MVRVVIIWRTRSISHTARPPSVSSTAATSTSARSTKTPLRHSSSSGAVRVAKGATVATLPAAIPANVPSRCDGNALLVPVESASSGRSRLPLAAARAVPSPPSVITQPAPRAASWAAAAVVSAAVPCQAPSSGSSANGKCKRSAAERVMPAASGRYHTVSTVVAAIPNNTRRTMLLFSWLDTEGAWVTTRRMSWLAAGLAMMPTFAKPVFTLDQAQFTRQRWHVGYNTNSE